MLQVLKCELLFLKITAVYGLESRPSVTNWAEIIASDGRVLRQECGS